MVLCDLPDRWTDLERGQKTVFEEIMVRQGDGIYSDGINRVGLVIHTRIYFGCAAINNNYKELDRCHRTDCFARGILLRFPDGLVRGAQYSIEQRIGGITTVVRMITAPWYRPVTQGLPHPDRNHWQSKKTSAEQAIRWFGRNSSLWRIPPNWDARKITATGRTSLPVDPPLPTPNLRKISI